MLDVSARERRATRQEATMILKMLRDPQVGQTVRFMPDRAVKRNLRDRDFTITEVEPSGTVHVTAVDNGQHAITLPFFLTPVEV